ncbi:MAG: cold shock domain-containing protein [Erysipelotrichales bacterium]|nr:cold shock domain-containing protein [Erysipelotrichales bacterium]MBQ1386263.1 cold shock domain-containing protein [Erysipelotrichales bacterium]MBQ2478340.1 cold shock domain-containing protein [Erysipelotrichales bacterium]MBQ4011507.1 cold shock domain-containing protein [Erysipelotrichales bacterium]MBQ4374853.1 cold shock domain-containing protein [Erysipelotrichales bacterium]
MTGRVKKFSKEKGYGFITLADGSDVFFHYTQIIMPHGETYREIDEGANVEFDVVDTERGKQAHNVKKIFADAAE